MQKHFFNGKSFYLQGYAEIQIKVKKDTTRFENYGFKPIPIYKHQKKDAAYFLFDSGIHKLLKLN